MRCTMDTTADTERLRRMAESLGCLIPEDFRALAGITESTESSWRKRGTGPAYVLIGNRYFYPRQAVADFMQARTRRPRRLDVRAAL